MIYPYIALRFLLLLLQVLEHRLTDFVLSIPRHP
jgi:hypothetical protein